MHLDHLFVNFGVVTARDTVAQDHFMLVALEMPCGRLFLIMSMTSDVRFFVLSLRWDFSLEVALT